ncbi:FAD binding domain-containing protein [Pseudenhygromyxa sp. WMMC2535]|uniref:FAD binding domain-containing protein n=1 Tax=Pseudenhygromyxa sp. WMMC2535 TaxID=2712867 RepID=UPI0015544A96|nr:FAD binding domain-containing protein [Pseudenhygromyxa sp. WMMC2535]NVB42763.1 FAD binding domain-containing protein [Pseudenhygromyxa sp. WMMC2535]
MLRLPQFGIELPEDIASVITLLRERPGARLVAGGTDILPNLKHHLDQPPALISLARVAELRRAELLAAKSGGGDGEPATLYLGAGLTLTEVAEHPLVREHFPSLATAAGLVASPLIRNMGTLGGNLNLDTRCRYVNQTKFWRDALGGGCLKSEGNVCHVVPKGRNCVAAMSSDCVPVLISLDAEVELAGPEGTRVVPAADYFRADGLRHTVREHGELTTGLRLPLPAAARRCAYAKWTVRQSIDFPLISLALRFDLAEDSVDAAITDLRVVAGVLGAKPRQVARLDEAVGKALRDPAVAQIVAGAVHKQCKPLENVPYEAPYRRQMLRVHARRAIAALVEAG